MHAGRVIICKVTHFITSGYFKISVVILCVVWLYEMSIVSACKFAAHSHRHLVMLPSSLNTTSSKYTTDFDISSRIALMYHKELYALALTYLINPSLYKFSALDSRFLTKLWKVRVDISNGTAWELLVTL